MITTNAMRKYRKILSITLASLLLAATFPVNGGTSLAKSAPATLGAPAQFNLSSPLPLPFPFNGALLASASAFPAMAAANGSDFSYLIRTCQTFGSVDPGGSCAFRGRELFLNFTLPTNLNPGTAHLMLNASGIGSNCNRFEINGTQIGILLDRNNLAQQVTEISDVPAGVLRVGNNTLRITSLNETNCTDTPTRDAFLINHVVLFWHLN
jgi:hypothetical protein